MSSCYMIKKRRGYTLIELMVSSAIISLVVTILSLLIIDAFTNVHKILSRTDLTNQSKQVLETISRNTRLAQDLPDSVTINGTTYQASASTLILTLASINSAGE